MRVRDMMRAFFALTLGVAAAAAPVAALPAMAQSPAQAPATASDGPAPVDPKAVQSTPLPPPPASEPAPAAPAAPAAPVPPTDTPAQAGPQHPDAVTGEMTVLNPAPVLVKSGSSSWENGFDTIVSTLDAVTAQMGRIGLKRAGDVMVAYTSSDEAGFEFEVQVPFSGDSPERPSDDVRIGASFSGRVMKFHHSGSFADMDGTYEAIANYLDSRNVEAQNTYIERYLTDPATTAPDALQVDIFVPLR